MKRKKNGKTFSCVEAKEIEIRKRAADEMDKLAIEIAQQNPELVRKIKAGELPDSTSLLHRLRYGADE